MIMPVANGETLMLIPFPSIKKTRHANAAKLTNVAHQGRQKVYPAFTRLYWSRKALRTSRIIHVQAIGKSFRCCLRKFKSCGKLSFVAQES